MLNLHNFMLIIFTNTVSFLTKILQQQRNTLHNLKFCTLLVISTFTFCETPEQFPQCQSTERLEKIVEQLAKQMSENQETMQELLLTLEIERAEKKAVHQQKLQQFVKQEEEQEKLIEWFENLPWYQHYSLLILAKTKPWIEQELWPTMKAIITNMIARKIVETGLSGTDFVLGDVPEKIFPNRFGTTISLRPGEFLTLSSEQRASNATLRKLNYSDSEFKQMKKEIEKLEKELSPQIIADKTEKKLRELQAMQALAKHPEYKKYHEELKLLRSEAKLYKPKQELATEFAELARNKENEAGFDEFLRTKYAEHLINRGKSNLPTPAEEVAEPTRNS